MVVNKYLMGSLILFATGVGNATQSVNHAVSDRSLSNNLFTSSVSALRQGHLILQGGGYWSHQGKAQHIDIEGLIGDTFTLSHRRSGNGAVGVGYFIGEYGQSPFAMTYGINGFYLPQTAVSGNVIQEDLFTNLSYRYQLTHYPVYAVAKSTIPFYSNKSALTLDVGIGPNFMHASGFQEHSLDNGVTLPDQIFASHTSTTFSATAGVGVKLNQLLGNLPIECGYRFFYLGQGHLASRNNQVQDNLRTGTTYANAVLCSVSI